MKKLPITLILILFAASAFAQNGKISGTIQDASSSQPVEYATIALNDSEGNTIDGTIADGKGKFTINKVADGEFTVVISFIGYETITKKVTIEGKNNNVDLGTLILGEGATQLDEIVVEGQKAIIEERVDRTIYNAEKR